MHDLNRIISLIAATLLTAAMAGSATAQMPGTPGTGGSGPGSGTESTESPPAGGGVGSPEFQKLDKNQDGSIDKKEASRDKNLKKKWSSLDLDKNDKVDYGEFARFEAEKGSEGSSEESSPPPSQEKSPPTSPMLP